ncbi:MAG: hypothetical protein DCC73_10245 [Proteobacteria bacterium]|nr:MAG: hypothetical protein DCC73_10245 [Pseudomonadota bacterium]
MQTAEIRPDVQDLVTLAQRRDAAGRNELFSSIADLLINDHRDFADVERTLMCDILRRLTKSVEMSIRTQLAERLAYDDEAPADLIVLLANDQIEVARSVLLYSKLLRDSDLINIVRHKTIQHQLSIAARQNLSSKVSAALVQTGTMPVLTVLLANPSANIPHDSYAQLVSRSEQEAALREPLVNRRDLPPELAKRMYRWVSAALKDIILKTYMISPDKIDEAIDAAVDGLAREDRREEIKGPAVRRLVDKLYEAGQLTSAYVVKSLNQGQAELFEESFAKLAKVNIEVFRKILYNRGADGLAVACRVIGIDRSMFLTIYRLTRIARRQSSSLTDAETAHAFEIFRKMDQRQAEITLHRWAADESKAPIF